MDRKEFAQILNNTVVPEGTDNNTCQGIIRPLCYALIEMMPGSLFRYRNCSELNFDAYYKMIKYIRIIFLALLIIPVQAYAQQAKCTVSGRVIDGMSSPVAYASVAVYKDNSPLTGTITDHEGKFSLKVAQGTDSCQLVVEFIGYSKVSQEFVSD